jgi:hypothetical protein
LFSLFRFERFRRHKLKPPVNWWDEDFDYSFSALITGKAIIHTTGMPVAYSFELKPVQHISSTETPVD